MVSRECSHFFGLFRILSACYILWRNDGAPVRTWHNITLNAAVSILATLTRGMILISTASCLGQYKWIWFKEQRRPLPDFEVINEASKGPTGALRLLILSIKRIFEFSEFTWAQRK
jgi:hypothetical protein